jgi:hypothetical protein
VLRNLTRRAGIRLLTATVGVGALVAFGTGAAGAAQASTGPAGAAHGKPVLVSVTSTPRAVHAGTLATTTPPYPSNCAYNEATCTYDTGLTGYNNGDCQAEVVATWWGTPKNILNVEVRAKSPYPFAGCRAYGTVYFGMNSGAPLSVGPFYSYACGAWDPTCSADRTWTYQVQQAVPQDQLSNINSIYAGITH